MKRLLITILCSIFLLNIIIICPSEEVYASLTIQHQAEAEALKIMGVFKGTDKGFELDRVPTRIEGAVMFVRLLGMERSALQTRPSHPFKDVPAWADPYVGYMYQKGLTTGTSPGTYSSSNPLTIQQYMSFILRALTYDDNMGDFTWTQSLLKAHDIGILNTSSYEELCNLNEFYRDHMVWVSYLALQGKVKGQDYTLLEELVENDQVISVAAATASGMYEGDINNLPPQIMNSSGAYSVRNPIELEMALQNALINMEPEINLFFYNYTGGKPLDDFSAAMEEAEKYVSLKTGIDRIYESWRCEGTSKELKAQIKFVYNNSEYVTLMKKVKEIITNEIHDDMSDYEKEKTLHDYIVNNAEYDYDNFLKGSIPELSYTAYGVLVLGRGVCQGYAEAMHLLCCEAGVRSMLVEGDSIFEGQWFSHAWNIVQLDGEYYQLDVCWDDLVTPGANGRLNYNYFNLTDTQMSKDHSWDQTQYPLCSSDHFNYYVYNNQQVVDYNAFKTYLDEALSHRVSEVSLKVLKFNPNDYGDISSLVFQRGTVQRYNYSIDDTLGIISLFNIQYN